MGARNCARCGKVFTYLVGPPLCPVCREKDEEDYRRVKEYLYQYPGSTLMEVSQTLDISVNKIKRFLKEGRLEIKDLENFFLECERCGTAIKSGQYCDSCAKELSDQLKGVSGRRTNDTVNREKDAKTPKMRFLNKDSI